MSVVVTEENQTKVVLNQVRLDKVKNLLGAKTESETLEILLDKAIDEFELNGKSERKTEDLDIDVHTLNRIHPKKSFKVKANFYVVGRRKPMKFDFSDFVADENEEDCIMNFSLENI